MPRNPLSGDAAPSAQGPFAQAGAEAQDHARLIRGFYAAFHRRDHEAMAACYAPEAQFRDPVFMDLTGWRIAAMWRMLCERATDLHVSVADVAADAARAARLAGRRATRSRRPVVPCTM